MFRVEWIDVRGDRHEPEDFETRDPCEIGNYVTLAPLKSDVLPRYGRVNAREPANEPYVACLTVVAGLPETEPPFSPI